MFFTVTLKLLVVVGMCRSQKLTLGFTQDQNQTVFPANFEEPEEETPGIFKSKVCFEKLGCFERRNFFDWESKHLQFLPDSPEDINVGFKLFTGQNKKDPVFYKYDASVEVLKDAPLDPRKKTVFIIHGFLEKFESFRWMTELKDLILDNKPELYNVIGVDWSGGSQTLNYYQSVANTRVVGAALAYFIRNIREACGVRPADIHMFGHSLGAHICAYAAQELLDDKIGRITGLDPAGPCFYERNGTLRLSPDDARFVDNVHTDANTNLFQGFGIDDRLGQVDFYPNGGTYQPGCAIYKGISHFFKSGIYQGIAHAAACSHQRSTVLVLDIVPSRHDYCQHVGYPCESFEKFEKGECATCIPEEGCNVFDIWSSKGSTMSETYRFANPGVPLEKKLFFKTAKWAPFCLHHYQILARVSSKSNEMVSGFLDMEIIGTNGKEHLRFGGRRSFFYPDTLLTQLSVLENGLGQIVSVKLRWNPLTTIWTKVKKLFKPSNIFISRVEVNYMSNISPVIRKQFSGSFCPVGSHEISSHQQTEFEACLYVPTN